MSDSPQQGFKLKPEQEAIRAKCFHPSGTFIEFPKKDVETSLTARFEKIVGQFPDRIAVKMRNRTLTYQELNHAANRLAHAILAQRGKIPEPVALLMEHDSQLMVAIVGVLKAGKICVVLDPSFPKARSAFLLEDSQAGLLITDNKSLSLAREYAHDRCRIVNIDELDSGFSIDNPGLSISPDHFAFLVYTSGSTGRPKGVIQNHRNLLHDGLLYCNGLHICADDRVALLYSCGASQGLKITFATLLSGATLHPFHVQQKGVADLALWLNREEITIYFSIPIIFHQFVGTITGQAQLPRLRIIQLGSDLVTHRELQDYQRHFSADTILIIRFGTTETGTLRRMFFNVEPPFEETTVPVGYATEDSHISLLDEEGKEVKCDAIGEIVVESRYISPGYWRRADLTRETFFSDPNGGDKRIYHTGDLGRLRSDGLLYHLGRKDFQLNIRGYRVEAGEIEAALLAQGNVKEAVVATGKASAVADDDRLIAYIVPFERPRPSTTLLRRGVSEKLPAYMIPSDFVFLESLPQTPNGKIDRRALPVPDQARPELEATYIAPQSAIEKQLAQIWTEVLSITPVGIHDSFFDLGGHSLSATRLVSRVIEHFQLEVPPNALFQSPTVAEMAAVIAEHQERELSDADGGFDGTAAFSLRPIPRDGNLPLSFAQQRLWFLDQLEPDSAVYSVRKALRLRGRLNREVLQKALDAIVERHEVLRTTFSSVDGKPIQIIHEHGKVELSAIDLMGYPDEQRKEELHRLMGELTHRPFELEKDWPLRAALIRWAGEEHVLIFVTHHIASDGWSNDILFRELSALYEAFCQGKGSPLKDLPIQYADYAVWQREWLQGEVLQQQLSYWKRQLEGFSPLELPTDHPRPAVVRHPGQTKTFKFFPALAQDLKNLSRQEHVTLFMTLLAAFQTLLHRYTGQDDIVVGSPIAGRTRVEVEGLIGFFVNTLVLRNDLSGNPTFRELLARVRKNALDAYTHQEVPFEKLVEELQPERDLGRNPFFQVIFQLRNYPTQSVSLGDLTIEEYEFSSDIAKFDLSVGLRDDVTGLSGSVEYRTELFDPTTIERMIGHFQKLLEGVVTNPNQALSEIPLLTDAEKHELLVEWNDTGIDYPKDKCIHELFEEQVERTPDAIAVVFEDQRLTYKELNQRANQLAHYLQKRGVGPDVLVGICVERSIEMIVGLLGILKAGGAYVPLDPSYPKERLAFMLKDTQTRVLLTQKPLAAGLIDERKSKMENSDPRTTILDSQAKVICLDGDWDEVSKETQENPRGNVAAENLAYVIYTSGSTGKPKGVAVEHRQFINYLESIIERLDLTTQRSFATVSTLAADLGNTVIFSSLCGGAALHVISRDRVADAEAMADYFSRHAIDCLKIVPSHLAALQSVSRPQRVLPRQLLILGGEASDVDWVKRVATHTPSCRIVNHYGPTETTVGVMTYGVKQDALPVGLPHLPLGRPIANTQVYVLDQNLNPVPIGVAGEIYVGGLGLARGYLNRPELTVERFIPNPFSGKPGTRLYKTGDQARYLPDGNIEFLGRIDNQIKLRGYRIEPGEIEAALKQHPEVREAVVLDRSGTDGEKQLAAYLIVTPERAPTTAGKPRYRLPNGTAVVQLNKNETDYIYREIFERQAYLRHGITVRDGDCIFDVGANIGLFTLFADQIAKCPKTYAFEPNPAVYEILKANAKLYGTDVRLFNCGLSDKARSTTFTFFPGFSLLSGFYADAQAEKQVVKTFIINQQKAGVSEMNELVEQADAILAERFAPQSFDAELRTVSSVIEQEDIESIDLLKINAEKSELDVLNGIKDQDWPKIKQIVLEVDVKENLPTITSLLEGHGYEYVVEQDNLLEGTTLCYVYAIRPCEDRRLIREQPAATHVRALPIVDGHLISVGEVRAFLTTKLPEYMIPSFIVFMDALPLTPNGKVDRQGLLALVQSDANSQNHFEAPRTTVETLLAQIWADVLRLDQVGIHDNFFELGGHSLLATQVISRMRNAFHVDLPLRSLFESPTVAGLAERIDTALWAGEKYQPARGAGSEERDEIEL